MNISKILGVLLFLSSIELLAEVFPDIEVFPIANSSGKDLSGLAICNGSLVAVADNIDDKIFSVSFENGGFNLSLLRTLNSIPDNSKPDAFTMSHSIIYFFENIFSSRLDWEAIECNDRFFYLASENRLDLLAVSRDDSSLSWTDLNIYGESRKYGLSTTYNAFIEGIALREKSIIAFFERNERGAVIIDKESNDIKFQPLPNDYSLKFVNDSFDIAGAHYEKPFIYTLERNAYSVCKRNEKDLSTVECISYQHIETSPEYSYENSEYGLGEGLAMDDNSVFIVFDNNRQRRISNNDGSALLLKIERPKNF